MLCLAFLLQIIYLAKGSNKCSYDLQVLWHKEFSHSPFAAIPVIGDLSGSGKISIVASSFDAQIHVIEAATGEHTSSAWPVQLPHSSIHAKPLLYDSDGDGKQNIVTITSQGEIVCINPDTGDIISRSTIDKLFVDQDWHNKILSADPGNIHEFILDTVPDGYEATIKDVKTTMMYEGKGYVGLDPHVLADPIISPADELVLPISYFLDPEDYPQVNLTANHEQHLVSALLFYNLTTLRPLRTLHLELTAKNEAYPGYVLASPLVVDLDADEKLEYIIGTSAGRLHVIDSVSGKDRPGFPIIADSIQTEASVADINGDGLLELVFIDISGIVRCIENMGDISWEAEIPGDGLSGAHFVEFVEHSAGPEVLLASSKTGQVHVLNGATGESISKWPAQLAGSLLPVSPRLWHRHGDIIGVVTIAKDGHLHMLSEDGGCRQALNVGEKSLVGVVVEDIVEDIPGEELIVLSTDGSILCMGVQTKHADYDPSEAPLMSSKPFNSLQVMVTVSGDKVLHISSTFVTLNIHLKSLVNDAPYQIIIKFGRHILHNNTVDTLGEHTLTVDSPISPGSGHIQVLVKNRYAQISTDTIYCHFHQQWKEDVKYIVAFPVIMLITLLLFGYGYLESDLLPFTQETKDL